ncbi:DUF6090 family protein [Marinigracilibium pacificum]|uniref:Uncharacterized protein n=1 Tax=Marinigracilibium pacificum TaxID=2729599 RepID=A0A848J8I4_9BACT|nr:DUF6090 family protein [Marinigracilibium pacificum]NMM50800.1 hypothetical protein [Marinigracilibium pacificum]
MKNRILTHLKRFIFEFVIVTLGILSAFSINKWDENRKLKAEEITSYKALKSDLESELFVFSFYKKPLINARQYLKPVLENNHENIDSLLTYLHTGFDLQERNATYINLKYSGKLGLISNDKIKSRVTMYYETYYQGLESMSNWNYDFNLNFLQPYMIANFKFNPDESDILENLKQDEFLNLIRSRYQLVEYNISTIEKSENLINKIIEEIDAELIEQEKDV